MMTKKSPKSPNLFFCSKCDYTCSKKSEFNRHVLTRKHKNDDAELQKSPEKVFDKKYACNCGKEYIHRQGLYVHKKKCTYIESSIIDENEPTDNKVEVDIIDFLKKNQEFQMDMQKQMFEFMNTNIVVNNNSNINSNNKTFNLNVFLNEQCKDAMNLTDFVDSLQLQLTDLEKIGELGYVNGLSSIIIRNLKAMDIHKRPVHCSDAKRETIFIKEEDKWEKENDENEKLNKAIKTIANKNIRMIPKWREKYPECAHSDSCKSDQYNNIIIQSLDTNPISNHKIITNIAKEVKIVK